LVKVEANPFWPHETNFPKLARPITADVVVVGGGIAGVCSAYCLWKKGYKVALVEAERMAWDATGASSGIIFPGNGTYFQEAIGKYGLAGAKTLISESRAAIGRMFALIEKRGIACGLRKPGIIYAASNAEESKYVRGEIGAAARLGVKGRPLDGGEAAEALPSARFTSGAEFECGQIHPGIFVAALCAEMAEGGAAIFEKTAMLDCIEAKGGVVVKTAGGDVAAGHAVIATNAKPFRGLESHFSMEHTTVVPSRPLGKRLKEVFGREKIIQAFGAKPDPKSGSETFDLLYPIGDRVFLEVYSPKGAEEKARRYFPEWTEFDFASKWGGSWAKSSDMLPIAGRVTEKTLAAVAMGDQGIVMGFTCGSKMPEAIDGRKDAFLEMVSPARFR
jgi:gamma-glutamylputrescine oxidase